MHPQRKAFVASGLLSILAVVIFVGGWGLVMWEIADYIKVETLVNHHPITGLLAFGLFLWAGATVVTKLMVTFVRWGGERIAHHYGLEYIR